MKKEPLRQESLSDEHPQQVEKTEGHSLTDSQRSTVDQASAFPVIQTKIQPPYRAPELLTRNRLVNLIHSHLDRKLIILSAQAGYGKTSLLVDFAAETDFPVCWLTLDKYDRDLRLFLEYFIASISARFPKFGKDSRQFIQHIIDPTSSLNGIAASIIQDIQAHIPEYFVMILDDYHTIDGHDSIAEFLDLFITYVDENCHLILVSRNLVALPNLVLLIARRMAAGLSIDELRFTPREIQTLAQQNYQVELDPGDADRLVQRTAGWITGILLTADPHWKNGDSKLPQRGRINQEIYDYLTTQLLDHQPEALRQFLLHSSILEEVTANICESVLGINDSEELIRQVRERNLFVAEYDLTGGLLRYNDLFRDFLLTRYKQFDLAGYRQHVLKAAAYHKGRGEWERAIERYQELGETNLIVSALEQIAGQYFDTGRWDSLAAWLDNLPGETLGQHPFLLGQRGKIHAERGQHNRALDCFDRAEKHILLTGNASQSDLARILVLKASVLRLQDQYTECIAHCQQALVLVDDQAAEDQQVRALAHKNIGLCWLWLGDSENGQKELLKSLRYYSSLSSLLDIGMVHHDIGLAHELSGDLSGASEHYRTALSYWEQLENPSPWANELNSLGVIYHLRGILDQAEIALHQALEKSRLAGDLRIQAYILASLGDIHRDLNNFSTAKQEYAAALEIAQRSRTGMIITYALDGLGNLARVEGDHTQARHRLDDAWQHASENNSAYELSLCEISLGVLANESGNLAQAANHLDEAICRSEQARLQQHQSRAYLHRAQTEFLSGETTRALEYLQQALDIADLLDYDQYLVFDCTRLRNLLQSARFAGMKSSRLDNLLEKSSLFQKDSSTDNAIDVLAESLPELRIHSFGKPKVLMDGEEVHWEVSKSRDLFFLILQTPQGLTRDQIGSVFWPDHNPERLDPAFRSTMYRLRRSLYRDSVIFMDGLYRFDWSGKFWYDRLEFDELVNSGESAVRVEDALEMLETALDLYQGDYLESNYDDWCGLERERLRTRHRFALEKLAGLYSGQKRYAKALHLYQTLTREDPYNEDAHRELIRGLAMSGDRARAIRQYQALVRMLWDELGLRPDPQTEALYLEIID